MSEPEITEASPSFTAAVTYISSLPSAVQVSTETKLELYALYKIVTVSLRPQEARPSIFSGLTSRPKWDAWEKFGNAWEGKDVSEVEDRYLEIASSLGWSEDPDPQDATSLMLSLNSQSDGGKGGAATGMGTSVSTMAKPIEAPDTSLHGLALSGDVTALALWLDSDPSEIDLKDEYGFTPLILASDRGLTDVVKFLLGRGADPEIKDPDGDDIRHLAKIAGHEDVVQIIDDHFASRG